MNLRPSWMHPHDFIVWLGVFIVVPLLFIPGVIR